MLLIGLTGGIASGKSLVTDRFAELGAATIDADVVARAVVEPGSEGLAALVERFGEGILAADGTLDRPALRTLVFAEPAAREAVDAILHPLIRTLSARRITAAFEAGAPYVVYAVPLLVETGQAERFDRIVVVDVPVEVQLSRLLARDGRDAAEARRILDAQATREQRLAVANDVIVNEGSVDATRAAVDALHARFLERADMMASLGRAPDWHERAWGRSG